tara:strand:+ start:533 stop:1297 length:765 start_codon:yes stop_codon:yes gene_type:complete
MYKIDNIIKIAKNAGKAILEIYSSTEESINISYKNDNSPLTAADKASNDIICNELEQISRNIPILSEEGKHTDFEERKKWNQFWLIDPLDGTKEFINRNGEFTVNIALIDKGKPILGVVHAPVNNITWYTDGEKSYKIENGISSIISVKTPNLNDKIKVVSSRSHANNPKLENYLNTFKKFELVKMGSSIKICLVADGSAHLYPRFGPTMEWDTAAAHAVVKFAGGNILNMENNKELSYNKSNLLNPEFLVNNK